MAAAERVWAGLCTACNGCVLHVGHAGACKIGEVEEEEYEMERIIAQRSTRKGTEYLVKWIGWPAEDSTWEFEKAFKEFDCMDTLKVLICLYLPRADASLYLRWPTPTPAAGVD